MHVLNIKVRRTVLMIYVRFMHSLCKNLVTREYAFKIVYFYTFIINGNVTDSKTLLTPCHLMAHGSAIMAPFLFLQKKNDEPCD
jgi:hypothetical protein